MKKQISLPAMLSPVLLVILLLGFTDRAGAVQIDADDFDVKWSLGRLHTDQIQSAVDACAEAGGGSVRLSSGLWVSGTVFLRSGVKLHLEDGAVLAGAPLPSLFPPLDSSLEAVSATKSNRALLFADGETNIGVTGNGTLLSPGLIDPLYFDRHERPHLIKFVACEDIEISGVRMRHASNWTQLYLGCRRVTIQGIDVYSHSGSSSDGLDIDACEDVSVSDSVFDTYDDAVAVKSSGVGVSSNIRITGCTFRSMKRGIKIGTESIYGFRDIAFEDCTVEQCERTLFNLRPEIMRAGMFIAVVDGGVLDRVSFSDIRISDARTPIFTVAGRRSESTPTPDFRDISFLNITGKTPFPMPMIIASTQHAGKIGTVKLENIRLVIRPSAQSEEKAQLSRIHPAPGKPKYDMFGMFFPECSVWTSGVETLIDEGQPPLGAADICRDNASAPRPAL